MKVYFLQVASFGQARGVKEKIAQETVFFNEFFGLYLTHFLRPFLNCQNISKSWCLVGKKVL